MTVAYLQKKFADSVTLILGHPVYVAEQAYWQSSVVFRLPCMLQSGPDVSFSPPNYLQHKLWLVCHILYEQLNTFISSRATQNTPHFESYQ